MPLTILALLLRTAAGTAFPVALDTDHPPAGVVALVRQLKNPATRSDAARRLGELDAAAPFVRDLFYGGMNFPKPERAAVLTALNRRRDERNYPRAVRWAAENRVDLLVDYGCHPAAGEGHYAQRYLLLRYAGSLAVRARGTSPLTRHALPYVVTDWPAPAFAWKRHGLIEHAVPDLVIKTHRFEPRLIQAETCQTWLGWRTDWFAVIRDDMTDLGSNRPHLHESVLLTNAPLPPASFAALGNNLIVTDGDIEFPEGSESDGDILIANGTIRSRHTTEFRLAYLWAAAGIDLPRGRLWADGMFASAGRVLLGPWAKGEKVVVRERANPLGLRFFKLADVGIAVAETPAGLAVTKVEPRSQFAAFGVRAGDLVTRVNDAPVSTAAEFRRQVRQSVVAEYGVFRLRRGGESLTRIVWFRDVVLPK